MNPRAGRPPFGLVASGFAVVLVVVMVAGFAVPTVASQPSGPDFPVGTDTETVIVALTAGGDARVTLVTPFDLTTDDEREGFDRLRANDSATARLLNSYRTRMTAVADRTADRTGREMAISDGHIALTTNPQESTGFVRLSVTWTGLATIADDRIELGAPFDSGFTADNQFVVVAPDDYELETVTPQPTTTQDRVAVWSPGTDLSGFSLVSRPAEEPAGETDDGGAVSPGGQPGFGLAIPSLAIATITFLTIRRRP